MVAISDSGGGHRPSGEPAEAPESRRVPRRHADGATLLSREGIPEGRTLGRSGQVLAAKSIETEFAQLPGYIGHHLVEREKPIRRNPLR